MMHWAWWFRVWAEKALVAFLITAADGWLCAVGEVKMCLPFRQEQTTGSLVCERNCWMGRQGWRLEQALFLGKVSPGCSLTGAGPLKSHLSWSFIIVMMHTPFCSHIMKLMLKLMCFSWVFFHFCFENARTIFKTWKKSPLCFPTPSEISSPSFKIHFYY